MTSRSLSEPANRIGTPHSAEGTMGADDHGPPGRPPVEHDLDDAPAETRVAWSLPHGGDLDANLIRLEPGQHIDGHVNRELDVLIVVRGDSGELTLDGVTHALGGASLALVPRGTRRSIGAGPDGIAYLTVHRRRSPLTVAPARPTAARHELRYSHPQHP